MLHAFRRVSLVVALLAAAGATADRVWAADEAPVVPPRQGKSETITLFNGKDLKGWVGHEKYWSVKDGVIVGKNTDEVPVSTYLLTERKFSDFRLVFDFKLAESEMHSGIAMWGRVAPEQGDPHTYAGHLVMFPSGYGFYDLYGRRGIHVNREAAVPVGKQHDWNNMEILAQGNRIRFVLNGVLISDWREPKPERIQEAPIGLQLHSNKVPQEVQFKNLVLETFPADELKTARSQASPVATESTPAALSNEPAPAPQARPGNQRAQAPQQPAPAQQARGQRRQPVDPTAPARVFNGRNLDNWLYRGEMEKSHWTVGTAKVASDDPTKLTVTEATGRPRQAELINAEAKGVDIYTRRKFGDATISLEFMIPKGSNSGVYVMGEYEVQILDSYGKEEIGPGDLGGLYRVATPKSNAAKAPGEWQTMEIVYKAPKFDGETKTANAVFEKVTLNGTVIHENVEMPGVTPTGVTGKEAPTGPLMLQGNHGPVAYRQIVITPAAK